MPDLPTSLEAWAKDVRNRLELTQADLASALGVSQSLVSEWERGVRVMQPPEAGSLCDRVGADDRERSAVLALLASARPRAVPSAA